MRDSGQKNAPHLKKGGGPAGSPAACLPCWLLPDALLRSLLLAAVPVLSLMAAQQQRGREVQSRRNSLYSTDSY